MECPFELPVHKEEWMIIDELGNLVVMVEHLDEADYIVQAINNHKKLVNALNEYGNHLPKCNYIKNLKGGVIEECDCGFEQALKGKP